MKSKCIHCDGKGFVGVGLRRICAKCGGLGKIYYELKVTLTSIGDTEKARQALWDHYKLSEPSHFDTHWEAPKTVKFLGAEWSMVSSWEAIE